MPRAFSIVVGSRKNGRARRRHAREEVALSPLACLPRGRPFSFSPTTSKRLLSYGSRMDHDHLLSDNLFYIAATGKRAFSQINNLNVHHIIDT